VGLMFCCCFIFLIIFLVVSPRPVISTYTYRTDLREICRIGRTLPGDEPSEVIFIDLSRDVAVATNFVGKIDLHSTPCSSHDIR